MDVRLGTDVDQPQAATGGNLAGREPIEWRWPAGLAILLGVALRLWQYLANPSLWVDEAALARNVLDRSVPGLFGALDYGQIAPPGFLLGSSPDLRPPGPSTAPCTTPCRACSSRSSRSVPSGGGSGLLCPEPW
ncbi:MAG TPA: hypothetical protein VN851_16580 [Thermoanaerobaculia bacterium]|nr:hypothetical protein [Thermoanaerobaculia bacterium]